jgi:hypothetical protein
MADRDRVVTLIERVGMSRLRFSVYDLRAEIKAAPQLALAHSEQLARHVDALAGISIRQVGRRFALGEGSNADPVILGDAIPSAGTSTSVGRSPKMYVRIDRWREYERAPVELDDLEKVWVALWVASTALGVPRVQTGVVTLALRQIPALRRTRDTQTTTELAKLVDRSPTFAAKSAPAPGAWSEWTPLGPCPDHPEFERWVAAFKGLGAVHSGPARTGHATLGDVARELVERAIAASRCPTWPKGRSVTVSDIEETARDGRAAVLRAVLTAAGTNVAKVLGDVSKARIVSGTRVAQRVIKLTAPSTGRSYYDVPDDPNWQQRALVVRYTAFINECRPEALDQLVRERGHLLRLGRETATAALQAIWTARWIFLGREIRRLLAAADDLLTEPLSKPVLDAVGSRRGRLVELQRDCPDLTATEAELSRQLRPFGLARAQVLNASRPMLTADDYVQWMPSRLLRGRRPSVVLADAVSLRRFPNPLYVQRSERDSRIASSYLVDRVEALTYLAGHSQARTAGFVSEGAALLGPWLRSSALLQQLEATGTPQQRRNALAALVLIDGEAGAQAAHARLARTDPRPPGEAGDALLALLVARQIAPVTWPETIRRPEASGRPDAADLRRVMRQIVLAAQQERWLLQP